MKWSTNKATMKPEMSMRNSRLKGCLSLILLSCAHDTAGTVYIVKQVKRAKGTPSVVTPQVNISDLFKDGSEALQMHFPPLYRPMPDSSSVVRTTFIRSMGSAYSDGIYAMVKDRPNPRSISNAFHQANSIPNTFNASDWMWVFGQFLDHDITEVSTNDNDPIDVPPGDPYFHYSVNQMAFKRSRAAPDGGGVYQQINDMTSVLDGNSIYGNTLPRVNYIRSDDSNVTGRLRTSQHNLMPFNVVGLKNEGGDTRTDLFLGGDFRANENVILTSVHTMWVREHNFWADAIHESDPTIDGDTVFNMARFIVQAEFQKVTYDEFLPALLGADAIPPYSGYKPAVTTGLVNMVASCVYRVGHTLVSSSVNQDYNNGTVEALAVDDAFFSPEKLINAGGIDSLLRGLATKTCQELDPFVVSSIRNNLLNSPLDLLSLNIQRGRDHGLPDFNSIREGLGFSKINSFDGFTFGDHLSSVYANTDQIDCWIGMNAEPRIPGLMVGPTQRAVLAGNFANIRDGDMYFYKHLMTDPILLALIEDTKLSDIIRRNADSPGSLDDIQDDVFHIPSVSLQTQ